MIELIDRLRQGLEQMRIELSDDQCQQLIDFLLLIDKWNKVHNLTAIDSPLDGVAYHLLDSLALLPYWTEGSLLDVGSGAGLPGIPLAIARPNSQVICLDSRFKRTVFLTQVVVALGLKNVRVVHSRVEDFTEAVDVITARAFCPPHKVCSLLGHLLGPGTQLLWMMGERPSASELAGICDEPKGVAKLDSLDVPFLGASRHVVSALF